MDSIESHPVGGKEAGGRAGEFLKDIRFEAGSQRNSGTGARNGEQGKAAAAGAGRLFRCSRGGALA
jgi:hypothetical protein